MKHYILHGRLFKCRKETDYRGLVYLTDEQEAFLATNPAAKLHEIRACELDENKPVNVDDLRTMAKRQIDSIAAIRMDEAIDAREKETAFVVVQLGQDGAMTLDAAKAFLEKYDRVNRELAAAKAEAYTAIDQTEDRAAMDGIVAQFSERRYE